MNKKTFDPENKVSWSIAPDGTRTLHAAYKGWLPPKNTNLGGGCLGDFGDKMLCVSCQKAFKRDYTTETCPQCGQPVFYVAPRVRVPRRLATSRVWETFLKRFCPKALPLYRTLQERE